MVSLKTRQQHTLGKIKIPLLSAAAAVVAKSNRTKPRKNTVHTWEVRVGCYSCLVVVFVRMRWTTHSGRPRYVSQSSQGFGGFRYSQSFLTNVFWNPTYNGKRKFAPFNYFRAL